MRNEFEPPKDLRELPADTLVSCMEYHIRDQRGKGNTVTADVLCVALQRLKKCEAS